MTDLYLVRRGEEPEYDVGVVFDNGACATTYGETEEVRVAPAAPGILKD